MRVIGSILMVLLVSRTEAAWRVYHPVRSRPAPAVVAPPVAPVRIDPQAYAQYLQTVQRLQLEAQARHDAQVRAIIAAEQRRPKEDPAVVDARVVKFLQQRVEEGSLDARFDLAQRHLEGRGVPRDDKKAMHLLQEAAAENHEASKRLLKQLSSPPSRE